MRTRMRALARTWWWAMLAGAFLLSGCGNTKTVVMLRLDGSGTITVTEVISQRAQDILSASGKRAAGKLSDQELAKTQEQAQKKAGEYGDGVSFVALRRVREDNGDEGIETVYAFTDINLLGFQLSGEPEEDRESPGAVTFHFVPGGMLEIGLPHGKEFDRQFLETFQGMLAAQTEDAAQQEDFRYEFLLRVEGRISGSTARYPLGEEYGLTLFRFDAAALRKEKKLVEQLAKTPPSDPEFVKLLGKTEALRLETQPVVTLRITPANTGR